MATLQYRATVEPNGRLVLPKEVQMTLNLKPGDEITVSFDRIEASVPQEASPRNEGMLSVLCEIEKRQEGRRSISGDETQRMLRGARAGGMYGLNPTETTVSLEADPTQELFAKWAEEDAQLMEEERAENERIYTEIEKNGIPRGQI